MAKQSIFLAHASEDKPRVLELYDHLKGKGFSPWLDEKDLLPGQNWKEEIPKSIREASIFLACLSRESVRKKGYIQRELRYALMTYAELPPGSIYLIPVRLEDCEVSDLKNSDLGLGLGDLQWVDLFVDDGLDRLVTAIEHGLRDRTNESHATGNIAPAMEVASTVTAEPSRKRTPVVNNEMLPFLGTQDLCDAFDERFCQAFPGVRGIAWFNDGETITERLGILLKAPLKFHEGFSLAWWFRGLIALHIDSFRQIEGSHFLMNVDELNIRRIAAVKPGSYYRSFVHVETAADAPTGLYPSTPESLARCANLLGYANEEYGLVDGKIPVRREELDDGAAIIEGRPVDIRGRTELRVRYLTPYNFLIAPNRSPINNCQFEQPIQNYLDQLIRGEDIFDEMCSAIERLPKNN